MPQYSNPGNSPGKDPNYSSPGKSYQGQDRQNNNFEQNKKPVPSEQVFEVECTGMKPETIHTFYYEGVDSGKYCKPKGKKIGDPIKTDPKGFVQFNFYFTGAVEKAIDISNKVKYELAGDKKFELKATDSSASKIVPMTGQYQEPQKPKNNFNNNDGLFLSRGGKG